MTIEALFELARFNVLTASITPGPDQRLADAFVFAWDRKLFPVFDESDLANAFEDGFDISKEKIDSLIEYLGDRWSAGSVPTFYELEDHYNSRGPNAEWRRSELISVLRYAKLSEQFDTAFFQTLLTEMKHPTEATSITASYDRPNCVYFA